MIIKTAKKLDTTLFSCNAVEKRNKHKKITSIFFRKEVKTLDRYTYKGYTIVISRKNSAVYAYKNGKLAYTADTEKGVEYLIDSAL